MPSTFPRTSNALRVTLGAPSTVSSVTAARVSMRVAGWPAFSRADESAMLKQPAWAAASSSSGFDPFLPSKRVPKLNEPLNAPLCALKLPLPSLSLPSQTATALLVAMIGCSDGYRGTGNLARHAAVRYASTPSRSAPDGDQKDAGGQKAGAQEEPSQGQSPPRRPATAGNAAPAPPLAFVHSDRSAAQHRLLS